MDYIKRRYKASQSEIKELKEEGFILADPFMFVSDSTGNMLRIPSFLMARSEIKRVIKNLDKQKVLNGTSTELRGQRDDLKEQLEGIFKSCKPIFEAVRYVLIESIEADYKRIHESDDSLSKKVDRVDRLKRKALDMQEFYGIKENDNPLHVSGLIWGTPVDDCLHLINHYGALMTIFEDGEIRTGSHFKNSRSEISLQKLEQLQKIAIPKAKEYIQVQIALLNFDTIRPSIGKNDIWKKFWDLDERFKQDTAYNKIESWLLNDLEYTRKEIKEQFGITLKKETFKRSARNNRPHNLQ